MAMYKLHYGTQAAYDAKKTAGTLVQDDLYFTSDTALIYKGDMLLSSAVEAVTEFPATGAQGRIYVDTDTLEAKVWNGSEWVVVSPAVETTLTDETAASALVTASAIRTYIESQIGSASVVQDVAYDSAAQKITITYGDGSPAKEILLKDLVTDVAYDPQTGNFTFSKANGEAKVVNTPVENFLAAAAYNADTHTLTLTMESGETIDVDLADLIDAYTVKSTNAIKMTMTGNEITAELVLSVAEGNALTIEDDGLFISLANYYTKAEVDAAIKVVDDKVVALDAKVTGIDTRLTTAEGEIDALQTGLSNLETNLGNNYYTKTEVDALLSWQEI